MALLCCGEHLFCWLVCTCPLRWQSLWIKTLFWLITFSLWWNISVLIGGVSSRMTPPPSKGHEDLPNNLYLCNIKTHTHLHKHQISTPLATWGNNMLDRALYHYHQSTNWRMFIFPVQFQKGTISSKHNWGCSGGSRWPGTLSCFFPPLSRVYTFFFHLCPIQSLNYNHFK